jgi:hypothetical protein
VEKPKLKILIEYLYRCYGTCLRIEKSQEYKPKRERIQNPK